MTVKPSLYEVNSTGINVDPYPSEIEIRFDGGLKCTAVVSYDGEPEETDLTLDGSFQGVITVAGIAVTNVVMEVVDPEDRDDGEDVTFT